MQQISSEPGASRGGEREVGGRRAAQRKSRAAQCAQGMAVRAALRGICAGLRPRFFLSAALLFFFYPMGTHLRGKSGGQAASPRVRSLRFAQHFPRNCFPFPRAGISRMEKKTKPCAGISPENALCTRLNVSRNETFCATPVFSLIFHHSSFSPFLRGDGLCLVIRTECFPFSRQTNK